MPKNIIVAQSGGPTPVINSTLRGVIDTCNHFPETFGTLYAGWHGIEGILKEELLDLTAQSAEEVALLRHTPAAGSIGTCRYKLKPGQEEDFQRVIDVMKAHDIGYFVYVGGNDSMDTANKVSQLAKDRGLDLIAVGAPKTIDNDVGDAAFEVIDHTPGYGSVARYWSGIVQNANEENMGSSPSDPVLVLQAMGRKIGFIPAAARLADPNRETPLLIFLAESPVTPEALCDHVNDKLLSCGRCIVVVSEGLSLGDIGASSDSFGHTQFSASKTTVAQQVVNLLNDRGLKTRGAARGQVSGTAQRDTCMYASTVDLDEAYRLGQKAALLAKEGDSGYMATILRDPGLIYSVRYDKVPLDIVANSERFFPKAWISDDRCDVTDEFLSYVRPLVGEDWASVPLVNGRQRFARFEPIFCEKKLPEYQPQAAR